MYSSGGSVLFLGSAVLLGLEVRLEGRVPGVARTLRPSLGKMTRRLTVGAIFS